MHRPTSTYCVRRCGPVVKRADIEWLMIKSQQHFDLTSASTTCTVKQQNQNKEIQRITRSGAEGLHQNRTGSRTEQGKQARPYCGRVLHRETNKVVLHGGWMYPDGRRLPWRKAVQRRLPWRRTDELQSAKNALQCSARVSNFLHQVRHDATR